MHCYIYASLRKADSYLWLAERDAFAGLPAELTALLGPLRLAMELDLHERRKLPHEDAAQVLENLRSRGWHLQLPPAERLASANHLAYGHAPRDGQTR
jgi:uncharacterized protein YcgL (UPF0745 family)